MWNAPTQDQLSQIPKLYKTEHIPLHQKVVWAHLFCGSSDWFVFEIHEGGDLMFCFAILGGDYDNSELGYVSLSELKSINVNGIEVDFDLFWTPCSANEIRSICRAKNWELQQPNKQMANLTA